MIRPFMNGVQGRPGPARLELLWWPSQTRNHLSVVVSSTGHHERDHAPTVGPSHAEAECYDSMASVKVWVDARGGIDT